MANFHAPYVPTFNKAPARAMEPTMGASTWALGSQRCTKNIGVFTKKGARAQQPSKGDRGVQLAKDPISAPRVKMIRMSGSEDNTV